MPAHVTAGSWSWVILFPILEQVMDSYHSYGWLGGITCLWMTGMVDTLPLEDRGVCYMDILPLDDRDAYDRDTLPLEDRDVCDRDTLPLDDGDSMVTLLWMTGMFCLSGQRTEIKLILTWKLHPYWLTFLVLEGTVSYWRSKTNIIQETNFLPDFS